MKGSDGVDGKIVSIYQQVQSMALCSDVLKIFLCCLKDKLFPSLYNIR